MEHAATSATLPATAAIVNFVVLFIVILFAAKKPMIASLKSRHEKWKSDLDESEQLRVKTEQLLSSSEAKMNALQAEVSAIFDAARKSAEKEKAEILAKANAQAEKILEDAKRVAQAEQEFMNKKLQKEMLAQAIENAKKELKAQAGENEHRAFLQNFVENVVTRG